MSQKRILIISHSDDLHVDILTPILEQKGHIPFFLKLDAFPRDYEIFHQFNDGDWTGEIRNLITGDSVAIAEIGAVWLRKSAEFSYLDEQLSEQERAFSQEETNHTLFGLFYGLDCYWINHPLANRHASYKGEQMKRAVNMGFLIPPSIITNSPSRAKDFKNSSTSEIVFKTLSSPLLGAEKITSENREVDGLRTTIIDGDLSELDAVAQLPCYFQSYIDKAFEVRVTVIEDKVFAARIDSQTDARTRVDYRDFSVSVPYQAMDLPSEVKHRCLQFLKSYGLVFGALDFIVTHDNEYIFLENNPGGQFWFVEQLVPELNMMETLADSLIKGLEC